MSYYSCFVHKHTRSAWQFVHKKCGIGRISNYGIRIKGVYISFGNNEEDKHNALIASQANRLLEYTQQFHDYLPEGILKNQIRETLENVQCFNYQQNEK